MSTPSRNPLRHTAFKAAACAATLAALLALATSARAQTDNFDSGGGSLDPAAGWATFSNPTYPTSYTFPTDSFGGHALRMQGFVPANAGPKNSGTTTARAAAVCTNNVYTDFYVAADLLNWQTNWFQNTNYTFLGLAARVNATLGGIASGTNWSGLALFNWLNVNSDGKGPGTAAMGLGWIVNGCVYFNIPMSAVTPPGGLAPASVVEWTLEPGHTYRLTFQGVGNTLSGQVFDTQDLTKPLGTIRGDTSLGGFAYPVPGVYPIVAAPASGWSGLCAIRYSNAGNGDNGYDTNGVTDATFDNFYAGVTPPATAVSAPGTPNGETGVAQVIYRTPASWANFYAPAGGITFTGSTLSASTTINTSGTRLILNGVDVSASLTPTPVSANTVYYTSYALAANTVYDAKIILEDSQSRFTTNAWTFDTFSDAYLAQYPNIECEDYDFMGGSWLPFPVQASGFSTNDNTWYALPGSTHNPLPLGYSFPINWLNNGNVPQEQWGYVGMKGIQAATSDGDGDFYECARTASMSGGPLSLLSLINGFKFDNLLPACEYRTGANSWPDVGNDAKNGDAVGTEEGAGVSISVWNITTNENGYLYANYAYDNKRQKYAALNDAGLAQGGGIPGSYYSVTGSDQRSWWEVQEYNVMGTEGSDWFNYTKDWGRVTNYNVYLRAACALTQHIYLHDGATNSVASRLGTFWCTNALMWNWRYTRLLDANGNPAVASLGDAHTLRLEIDPEAPKFTAVERGLALNYLSFVPATCIQVTINPPEAVAAGAQWAVDGGPWYNSGALVNTTPGSHTVSFKPCHWSPPTDQIVTVTQSQTTSTTGTYVSGPSLWSTTQLKKSGTSWTREWNAIVDTANNVVTNTLPATSTYYQLRWDINTKVTKVSKAGTKLILNFTNTVFVTNNLGYQAGLNIRAWPGTSGTPIEGTMFDFGNPSPVPTDSTPFDAVNFPNGLATIGYATQSINMDGSGPKEHFSATNNCGVAAPGPFPVGYSQYYAVEYRGLLSIATAGNYRFATTSDDGSALWIDAGVNPTYAQAIVQNNYPQGMTTRSNNPPINLTADYHDIIVRFNQGVGGNGLQLQWDPTGGANFVPIPGSLFYHRQSVIITNGP